MAPQITQPEAKIAVVEQKTNVEVATSKLSNKQPVISTSKESRDLTPIASHKTENKTEEAPIRRSWWDRLLGRK